MDWTYPKNKLSSSCQWRIDDKSKEYEEEEEEEHSFLNTCETEDIGN